MCVLSSAQQRPQPPHIKPNLPLMFTTKIPWPIAVYYTCSRWWFRHSFQKVLRDKNVRQTGLLTFWLNWCKKLWPWIFTIRHYLVSVHAFDDAMGKNYIRISMLWCQRSVIEMRLLLWWHTVTPHCDGSKFVPLGPDLFALQERTWKTLLLPGVCTQQAVAETTDRGIIDPFVLIYPSNLHGYDGVSLNTNVHEVIH
jgi:hypothetical protein